MPLRRFTASKESVRDITSLLGRTLVLVAHPDDETVGCGALLQRMREPVVAFCTDGAPRDDYFWKKYGSRLHYARVRQEEARRALSSIGVTEIEFLADAPLPSGEGIADQELHHHMEVACERVTNLVRRHHPQAIVTTAYEGGHPDHDSCSVLAASLGRQHELTVWEFPLYHRISSGKILYQRFIVPDEREEAVLEVTPEELENKEQMIRAYSSQHPFLFEFDPNLERFRRQHAYDYSRPPHPGELNYEAWKWSVTGGQVCAAFGNFIRARAAVRR
jgi:LmbE family N-acetylglucosaminyl deacetylase